MGDFVQLQTTELEAYHRGATDFHYFSALALPGIMRYKFPHHFIVIWLMLVTAKTKEDRAKVLRFALGLPRGFAKTTFIKILICWFIVYDHTTFVLVVCADEQLAYNLLADIDAILASPGMEAIYGKWTFNKAIDNREQKTCNFRKIPRILYACGAGSSVRGLNILNTRPDLILFDDMQTDQNAKSDVESQALFDKFTGTFIKLIDPSFAMLVYIGNMYEGNCILKKLEESPYWISLITGCILEDGTSLWPELQSVEDLFELFKHDVSLDRGHIWFAEMMNQPINAKTSLIPDGKLPKTEYTYEELQQYSTGGFLTIDPAGTRRLSDDNVIATHLLMEDGKLIEEDSDGGNYDPEQVIKKAVEKCLEWNLHVIGIESTAYQQSLIFWCNKYITYDPRFSHIQVVELAPAGRRKELRIIMWIREIIAGNYGLWTGDKETGHPGSYNKILFQGLKFRVGKKDNTDDHLDAGAYGLDMKTQYWEEILRTAVDVNPGKHIGVVANNAPF